MSNTQNGIAIYDVTFYHENVWVANLKIDIWGVLLQFCYLEFWNICTVIAGIGLKIIDLKFHSNPQQPSSNIFFYHLHILMAYAALAMDTGMSSIKPKINHDQHLYSQSFCVVPTLYIYINFNNWFHIAHSTSDVPIVNKHLTLIIFHYKFCISCTNHRMSQRRNVNINHFCNDRFMLRRRFDFGLKVHSSKERTPFVNRRKRNSFLPQANGLFHLSVWLNMLCARLSK